MRRRGCRRRAGSSTAVGSSGAPRAQREHRRAAGQRGALAEELDLDAVAGEVAVGRAGTRPRCRAAPRSTSVPAVGDERDRPACPSARAVSTNHSNSSGGSTGSATTVDRGSPGRRATRRRSPSCRGAAARAPRPCPRRRRPRCARSPAHVEVLVDPLGRRATGAGTARRSSGRTSRTCAATSRRSAAPPKSGPWTRRRLRSTWRAAPAHAPRRELRDAAGRAASPTDRRDQRATTSAPARYAKYDVRASGSDRHRGAAAGGSATARRGARPGRRARSADGAPPTTAPGCRRAAPRCPSRGGGACGGGRSGVAWRHTFTNRCTAVNAVSTSIIQSTGHEDVEREADAEEHEPLGPLHEPAAGVEPERLGPGPLVGDQHRQREDRHGEHGDRAACRSRRGTTRRRRRCAASATRSQTESKKAPRGPARPLWRATEPSRMSGRPVRITPNTPSTRWPSAISERGADRRRPDR